jgi:hypothetical protein
MKMKFRVQRKEVNGRRSGRKFEGLENIDSYNTRTVVRAESEVVQLCEMIP